MRTTRHKAAERRRGRPPKTQPIAYPVSLSLTQVQYNALHTYCKLRQISVSTALYNLLATDQGWPLRKTRNLPDGLIDDAWDFEDCIAQARRFVSEDALKRLHPALVAYMRRHDWYEGVTDILYSQNWPPGHPLVIWARQGPKK